MTVISAIVIGAGQRGRIYAEYALENKELLQIVGVVDVNKYRRETFAEKFDLKSKMVFTDWRDLVVLDRQSDCVFITTQDRDHVEPAVALANKGYHILLEKPMAPTAEGCKQIVDAVKRNSVTLAVCHVMRYQPHTTVVKSIIDEGRIGDIVNIQLLEPVGFFHFAHSYVRGNWRNEEQSSPILLAKSCHDLDLLSFWMGKRKVKYVSSFGTLKHFRPQNKGSNSFPVRTIVDVVDIENVTDALRNGPYGRCVYNCDNDVNDSQVVNLQYDDGATVSFSMVAFTEKLCKRRARIYGTKGELECEFDENTIRHFDFLTRKTEIISLLSEYSKMAGSRLQGHGGADYFTIKNFVDSLRAKDPSLIVTGPEESLYSHNLCFAAEIARKQNRVFNFETDIV